METVTFWMAFQKLGDLPQGCCAHCRILRAFPGGSIFWLQKAPFPLNH